MSEENLKKINEVISDYFDTNTSQDWIPAKVIMPHLIKAGLFTKDKKKGLPIRQVLRQLDKESALSKIPAVHLERKENTVYWYFVRAGKNYSPKEPINPVSKKQQGLLKIENSDEFYLVNLCDELLQQDASRKHTFNTLVGNQHKRGKGRTKLPLAAYYEDLKLVIEFLRNNEDFDALDKKAQQRMIQIKRYNQLKKKAVLQKNLHLVEIKYEAFECNEQNKLIRNIAHDKLVLKGYLKDFLVNNI